MDALFGRAAALRRVELVAAQHVIGKSTVESIQSGAVYGFSGQVDALVDRFQAELGECAVVATGGLAEPIIRTPARSSTTSPGSRSRGCASSSSGTSDRRRPEQPQEPASVGAGPADPGPERARRGDDERSGGSRSSRTLRAGVDPYPVRFDRTHTTAELHEHWDHLEDGAESADQVRVAGRVLLLRRQGKLTFATLRDGSGSVQLFVSRRSWATRPTTPSTTSTSATGSARRAR